MVVIRLARGGAKNSPYYRVMVADSRNIASGGFIEQLGFFNPVARGKEEVSRLDMARVEYWVSKGAQLSPRVKSIIKQLSK